MSGNQQTLSNTLRQEQQLSTRQLQSLELLNLPALELEDRLLQELAANPVLEEAPPDGQEEIDLTTSSTADSDAPEKEDEATLDEHAADSDEWQDELPVPEGDHETDSGELRDYLLNSIAAAPSLQTQLLDELAVADTDPRTRLLAEQVIGSIDDSGYLRTPAADIAMAADADLTEVERAIRLVQSFDPPGVGCRDLAECLKLQLERTGKLTPLLREILDHHLEDIARNRMPQLAKTLHITPEELSANLAELRKLNPHPGAGFAPTASEFVVPEAEIIRTEDGYAAIPRRGTMPRLFLAERYLKMLENPDLTSEERSYLREKLQQAREFMHALELRQSTILRIAEVLARTQRDFLDHGVEALHPLTMRQVGEELELHETTISRAVANKYIQTPRGIFPFRYFFSSGFAAENGEELSNRAVMEKIRELVDAEDPAKPLSDDKIASLLKQSGITVARRTVAKYREAINIPASNLRKKHF